MAAERRAHGLRSARVRTTLTALVVVGVTVGGAALGLVTLLQRRLVEDVGDTARLRAAVVAATLEAGTSPAALDLGFEPDSFVQVVDASGRVVASSPSIRGEAPVVAAGASDPATVRNLLGRPGDDFLAVDRIATTSTGPLRVIVGHDLDLVTTSTTLVARLLLLAVPVVIAVAGITAWFLSGRALAPVEVAQRKQRSFVADASHELRNPIAAIRQHAEVALAHPETTTVEELARDVAREDLRLERLAEDLLVLARHDEVGARGLGGSVALDSIVVEEADRLRRAGRVEVNASEVTPARVRGDRDELHRVVRNLADNAARHAESAVAFGVWKDGRDVVLHVDDDGPGIAPEMRTVVFERFTRADEARDRERGGAGLGLAIVAAIVESHGGVVKVLDSPAGGARLEVRLPAAS